MTKSLAANVALLEAVVRGRLRDVRRAVKNRADVTCKDEKGMTPIVLAAWRGDAEVVDFLAHHKESEVASSSESLGFDTYLNEALSFAVACGRAEVASVLLDYGADKDFQPENDATPLMYAAMCGHIGSAQLLLDWGADTHARTNKRATALHYAARNGRLQVSQLLLDAGAKVDAAGDKLMTPMMEAVREEHLAVVDLLQSRGACLSLSHKYGRTPLHFAAERTELAVVKLLLDRDQDVCVYITDSQGLTPLMTAARAGNDSILRVIFKRGSRVDATAKDGSTALHLAAYNGRLDACRVLIGGGADVNSVDYAGLNALTKAVQRGHTDVTKLLLQNGADARFTTDSRSLLHLAVENGVDDILHLLLDRVKCVDAVDDKRFTPLMIASQEGKDAAVGQLISRSANVDVRTTDGSSVLHLAVREGHLATCKLLLQSG
ncbi:Ankyrin repeat [Phytophthora infestans]|uniref:Ankyrin repeat n=1 Tax=Phytophthora infestans TaxID=4787 RepID=A0A8S9VBX9_PHYIN|nr:Ankyrin repeat [Phytophthora infestans]